MPGFFISIALIAGRDPAIHHQRVLFPMDARVEARA
jgi:hypothetical protein